ncbi:MAG: response regulator transcription factor [Pseudomonadota bacterium]
MRGIVLIVDDHPLVGEAFELSIRAGHPKLQVGLVTTAADAEIFVRKNAGRLKLILLDLMLPDATGFSAFLRLQQLAPGCPIAIISARVTSHLVSMAASFGAAGYLSKATPVDALIRDVGALLEGQQLFPADAAESVDAKAFQRKLASLSPAQLRVLTAMADGKLNKQIGAELDLTEGTVKQHMSAIFKKLGVNNRSQAMLAVQPFLQDMGES